MADFAISPWEDGEWIVTFAGKPIGCTLSKQVAFEVLRWAPSAFTEVFEMVKAPSAGGKP